MYPKNKKIKLCASLLLMDDLTPILLGGKDIFLQLLKEDQQNIATITALRGLRFHHFRNPNFFETWIDYYLESDFYRMFRMRKDTVDQLCQEIAPFLAKTNYHGGRTPVPIEKSILIFLRYLGHGDSLFNIADRFNVAESTVHRIISNSLEAILEIKKRYISWPNKDERTQLMAMFKKKNGFPGVIGAIDGTHIKCKISKKQQDSYCDRKFDHTITMQGICGNNEIFTHISVGWPGSIHDARIFKESSFGRNIDTYGPQYYFEESNHILGDSAYSLKTYLLTPYKDSGHLSEVQRNFNKKLSQLRVTIEHSFGKLKGRFRILKYIDVNCVERAVKIISACCILHNLCIKANDLCNDMDIIEAVESARILSFGRSDVQANMKRDSIAQFLMH